MIRSFDEYVREGIVVQRTADHPRAEALRTDAVRSFEVVEAIRSSIGITDHNANIIVKLAYDVVMSSIRAHMGACGFHASGRGAHEAEVAYLRMLGFGDADVVFCDRLRYYRNGIMYYGKNFGAEYARTTIAFASRMLEALHKDKCL
ncbi:MAG: hypothetical protein ACMXYM_05000 [Candidatus Woesearchaeota archaeon]